MRKNKRGGEVCARNVFLRGKLGIGGQEKFDPLLRSNLALNAAFIYGAKMQICFCRLPETLFSGRGLSQIYRRAYFCAWHNPHLYEANLFFARILRSHDEALWQAKFLDHFALLCPHLALVALVIVAQHVKQSVREKQRRLVILAVP